MRKIDADSIQYENHNGVMMVSKDRIDAMESEPIDITPVGPAKTKLEIIGFRTRCVRCGYERVFDGTNIGDYNFCERCGGEIMTEEEGAGKNVD